MPERRDRMGRPRKFKTERALADAWESYKHWCDNQTVIAHEFSQKNADFVSQVLTRRITYTIEGFCVWAGLPRQSFYATYSDNPQFCDIVTRMKEECEIDARMKFELGDIDPRLAALWMSKYGYSAKNETSVSGAAPVQIIDDIPKEIPKP